MREAVQTGQVHMGRLIEAINRLHILDKELLGFQERLSGSLNSLRDLQSRRSSLEKKIADLTEDLKKKKVAAEAADLEQQALEEHIKKLRLALNGTRTNREYAAILTEINLERANASKKADEALGLMTGNDQLASQLVELQSQLDGVLRRLSEVEAQRQSQQAESSAQVTELAARRSAAAEDLPAEVLDQYERLHEYHEGDCVANVERHGKGRNVEYVCGACQMTLRIDQVNTLCTRDELVTCGSCQRILVITEELTVAISGK